MQNAIDRLAYLGPHGRDIRLHGCRDAETEVSVRAVTTLHAQKRLKRLVVDVTALFGLGNKPQRKKETDEEGKQHGGVCLGRDVKKTKRLLIKAR